MTELLSETSSLCPYCLERIPARRIIEKNAVYLEKECPSHGALEKVLLWKNTPKPYTLWNRNHARANHDSQVLSEKPLLIPLKDDGCPFKCGICSSHKQHTCGAILEVTDACNLHCPVCFASSEMVSGASPDLNTIDRMLCTIRDNAGNCLIQLSGGEPLLRNDLPQIVALARKIGFDHIQVNTNGVRLAQDPDFGQAMKDAGVTDFFLQFDGVTDAIYQYIRGAPLLSSKLRALERCAELKIGVILVPTLVRNVNDHQIGSILQFAKQWMPAVRGVHFQPMAFLGRYPNTPRNADRILIPEILTAIEQQTGGELKAENFIPPG
jgi:7,8-dihydro-6-hydroxymethylpterin dimethyltransferase